jgi:hypothetical protein
MVFALEIPARGDEASEAPNLTSHGFVLPRDLIIPLSTVKEILPETRRETAASQDETAVDKPKGTRSLTYASADGSQRVVISGWGVSNEKTRHRRRA